MKHVLNKHYSYAPVSVFQFKEQCTRSFLSTNAYDVYFNYEEIVQ